MISFKKNNEKKMSCDRKYVNGVDRGKALKKTYFLLRVLREMKGAPFLPSVNIFK